MNVFILIEYDKIFELKHDYFQYKMLHWYLVVIYEANLNEIITSFTKKNSWNESSY